MKRTLYTCACSSLEHMFVITEGEDEIYLEVHLKPSPLLERVRQAIRHIFGHRSRYGNFEEIILTPEMALSLGDHLVEWSHGSSAVFTPNDVY